MVRVGQQVIAALGRLDRLQATGPIDAWLASYARFAEQTAVLNARFHLQHRVIRVGLAGDGVEGGTRYGGTDDIGRRAVDKRVSVNHLHATIFHLLGIEHTRLTYRYSGRDFRLTDVAGNVIRDVVA